MKAWARWKVGGGAKRKKRLGVLAQSKPATLQKENLGHSIEKKRWAGVGKKRRGKNGSKKKKEWTRLAKDKKKKTPSASRKKRKERVRGIQGKSFWHEHTVLHEKKKKIYDRDHRKGRGGKRPSFPCRGKVPILL